MYFAKEYLLTGVCDVTELMGKANPVTYFVGCIDMACPMPSPKVGVNPPIGAKGGTCVCVFCC